MGRAVDDEGIDDMGADMGRNAKRRLQIARLEALRFLKLGVHLLNFNKKESFNRLRKEETMYIQM